MLVCMTYIFYFIVDLMLFVFFTKTQDTDTVCGYF